MKDENDVPLVHHPVEMAKYLAYQKNKEEKDERDSEEATYWRVASFGSWVATADWDGDGDLDMLIGSFLGKMYLRENIGTRAKPAISGKSVEIEAGGKALKVHCHANPVVADWDGDGMWDLVVGSGDGSVVWYKNSGTKESPVFGSAQELVAAHSENKFMIQNLADGESPKPAVRAQICVTDYNLDGKLDLIVGDYSDINWTRALDSEEQKSLDDKFSRQTELGEQLSKLRKKMHPDEDAEQVDEETMAGLEKEYEKIVEEYMKMENEVKEFYKESRSASFIWLYERTDESSSTSVDSK